MKTLNISDSTKKDLKKLDKISAQRILKKLFAFSQNTEAFEIKKLKSNENLFRIRIGDFRAIFNYSSNEIMVLKIGHRKEIYK